MFPFAFKSNIASSHPQISSMNSSFSSQIPLVNSLEYWSSSPLSQGNSTSVDNTPQPSTSSLPHVSHVHHKSSHISSIIPMNNINSILNPSLVSPVIPVNNTTNTHNMIARAKIGIHKPKAYIVMLNLNRLKWPVLMEIGHAGSI